MKVVKIFLSGDVWTFLVDLLEIIPEGDLPSFFFPTQDDQVGGPNQVDHHRQEEVDRHPLRCHCGQGGDDEAQGLDGPGEVAGGI